MASDAVTQRRASTINQHMVCGCLCSQVGPSIHAQGADEKCSRNQQVEVSNSSVSIFSTSFRARHVASTPLSSSRNVLTKLVTAGKIFLQIVK